MKAFLTLIIAIIMTTGNLQSQSCDTVDVYQAREMIEIHKNSGNFFIIDARDGSQYIEGHIPGAIHIDPRIPGALNKLSPLDKSAKYLVYCRTRIRIFELLKIMQEMGFEDITLMTCGWLVWEEKGFEVEVSGLEK